MDHTAFNWSLISSPPLSPSCSPHAIIPPCSSIRHLLRFSWQVFCSTGRTEISAALPAQTKGLRMVSLLWSRGQKVMRTRGVAWLRVCMVVLLFTGEFWSCPCLMVLVNSFYLYYYDLKLLSFTHWHYSLCSLLPCSQSSTKLWQLDLRGQ